MNMKDSLSSSIRFNLWKTLICSAANVHCDNLSSREDLAPNTIYAHRVRQTDMGKTFFLYLWGLHRIDGLRLYTCFCPADQNMFLNQVDLLGSLKLQFGHCYFYTLLQCAMSESYLTGIIHSPQSLRGRALVHASLRQLCKSPTEHKAALLPSSPPPPRCRAQYEAFKMRMSTHIATGKQEAGEQMERWDIWMEGDERREKREWREEQHGKQ